ncbi:MAG: hypothetical protein WKF84_27315 [Pyrinomonadaceae bacterium]
MMLGRARRVEAARWAIAEVAKSVDANAMTSDINKRGIGTCGREMVISFSGLLFGGCKPRVKQ